MIKLSWFHLSVIGSFVLFCGVMAYAVWVVAHRPTSGSMGIDAAKIQVLRVQANEEMRVISSRTDP